MTYRRLAAPSLCLFTVLTTLAFAMPSAAYGERVFNANEQTTDSAYVVDSLQRVAQSFVPVESFVLYNVTLRVENLGSSPLNLTVRPDAAGDPGAAILAGATRFRAGNGSLDFPMNPRPTLLAGQKYWILADNQPALHSYRWFHANADVVPGEAKVHAGLSWTAEPADLTYVAYGLRLEPLIVVRLEIDRPVAAPGETFAYTVHLNNTGSRAAPNAWVNLTLPPEIAYVSDTAGSIGGTRTGPTAWTFAGLANGPDAFEVTATIAPGTPGGRTLTATVHLDHSDSAGASQPPSTDAASITVALKMKPMYLAHDGTRDRSDLLTAAPPDGTFGDFDGDGIDGMTLNGGAATWTLSPALARPLHLRGAITAELYLTDQNPGGTVTLNVTLHDRRGAAVTLVAWRELGVSFDTDPDFQLVTIDLGSVDRWVMAGNVTELRIANIAGDNVYVAYNRTDVPSRVLVTTDTYVSIDGIALEDATGPAALFSTRDTVYIRANVSDPFGSREIAGVAIDLIDPDGAPIAWGTGLQLTATDSASPSAWKVFTFVYPSPPKEGTYTFVLTATEGNGVQATAVGSFVVRIPILALAVVPSASSAEPLGVVRYTIYVNNTGEGTATAWLNVTLPAALSYSLDTAEAAGGEKTGNHNWTFPSVATGSRTFVLAVLVNGSANARATVETWFNLTYADEKGFSWPRMSLSRTLALEVGTDVTPPADGPPFLLLALLGAAIAAPPVGYLVWRGRRNVIEEVFLLHRDGILLYHLSRRLEAHGDADKDILGAMLTAVQDFARDAFRYGEDRDLNKLEFGEYHIVLERGRFTSLAVVFSGHEPSDLRRKLRQLLEEVENQFGDKLADFSGEVDSILGVRDIVGKLVA